MPPKKRCKQNPPSFLVLGAQARKSRQPTGSVALPQPLVARTNKMESGKSSNSDSEQAGSSQPSWVEVEGGGFERTAAGKLRRAQKIERHRRRRQAEEEARRRKAEERASGHNKRLETRKKRAREVADAESQQAREEWDRETERWKAHRRWMNTLAEVEEQQRRETMAWQAGATEIANEESTAAETRRNDMSRYDSLPMVELIVVARTRGLSTVGSTAIIVQRLREDDLAAAAEQVNDTQPEIRIHATRVTESDATEMENAQKVADDYDAREAHWTAAVYEANETGTRDMNRAMEAQQRADEQEAREAAQKVAYEMEAREERSRRREMARATLSVRAEEEGYVVSEEQIDVEVAAIEVQEAGEAILVRARTRNQVSTDAEVAQRLAEEYEYEEEQAKIQQRADAAMGCSVLRDEANEARRQRQGVDRQCSSEELRDHVEAESERKLICEYKYVPIPFIEEVAEKDGTGRLQLQAQGNTEHYVQKMVTREVERKKRLQQGPTSEVPEDVCACCREPTPRADRVYCNTCYQFACRTVTCFGQWMRRRTTCMYCVQPWQKKRK